MLIKSNPRVSEDGINKRMPYFNLLPEDYMGGKVLIEIEPHVGVYLESIPQGLKIDSVVGDFDDDLKKKLELRMVQIELDKYNAYQKALNLKVSGSYIKNFKDAKDAVEANASIGNPTTEQLMEGEWLLPV